MNMKLAKNIFVIEDDSYTQTSLTEVLADQGYLVVGAKDGEEALALLTDTDDESLPGVILLDLMMPVMDGYAFRSAQLDDRRLAKIPTFLLSAADGLVEKCSELKMDGIVKKPVDLEYLLNLILKYCT